MKNDMSKQPGFKRLRKLMDDPRYWRDQDPSYVEMIRQGFRDLYDSPSQAGEAANVAGVNGPIQAQDTEVGHLTKGEIIIPRSAQTSGVMKVLKQVQGKDITKYTVGSGHEQRNPTSGLLAFADTVGFEKGNSEKPKCPPGKCLTLNPDRVCIPFTDICFNEWVCEDCSPVGGIRG